MPKDPDGLVEITTRATEAGAEMVAGALRERGVDAQVVGGFLTGFRAEIPAYSTVLVRRRDLEQAKAVLAEVRAESVDLDWSEVDTNAPETPAPAERREYGFTRGGATRAMVMLACAFAVLMVASVAPSLWQYTTVVVLVTCFFLMMAGLALYWSNEPLEPQHRPGDQPRPRGPA